VSAQPTTVRVLTEIQRGPKSKIVVSLDEGENGSRFVSIKRLLLGKQGTWVFIRGISVQLGELPAIATALLAAGDAK
jgi:hypothetical protein